MANHDAIPGINFDAILKDGGMFWASIPTLAKGILELKLEGFDEGGIWVQGQQLTDAILRTMNRASLPATPVIFVPYHAIQYAYVLAEGSSLSAEKLGL